MYDFVLVVIVLNVVYEMVEFIFPIKRMGNIVKSFTLIIMLYALCDYVSVLF